MATQHPNSRKFKYDDASVAYHGQSITKQEMLNDTPQPNDKIVSHLAYHVAFVDYYVLREGKRKDTKQNKNVSEIYVL